MERRRYDKAKKLGCQFSQIPLTTENVIKVHKFINQCRRQQGLSINISLDDLTGSVNAMPKVYQAFAIQLDGEMIAATIIVNVTNKVAYNYLPASDKNYHHLSPMVMLMIELYDYLRLSGFTTMDWGVTSVNGHTQQSLASFKEAMGAKRTFRSTYVIE